MIISNPQLGIDPRMFIILDDVLQDKYRIRFSTALSNCWTNGRHLKISAFILLQDIKSIGPDLRENTDLAILFRVYEGGRKKVVYEEWLSYFDNNTTQRRKAQGTPTPRGKPKQGEDLTTVKADVAHFFWKNTGLLDPKTGDMFEENLNTTDEDRGKMPPQAIAIVQGRTTDNLQLVFRKIVAEDPGPFCLGDPAYFKAAATGIYKPIYYTDKRHYKTKKL